MKFHQLTLCNLKSLRGTYHLDFDAKFGSEELFLIFGEMGTGKTTMFDAISLALYGKTPQLQSSYSSPKNNSIRHILNTETEECYSSLIFSFLDEDFYRATWYFRNRVSNSNPNAPTRTLERLNRDFETVEVLCSTPAVKVAETEFFRVLCGLGFPDFIRGVFLPQNQFTKFISEAPKERTDILERITNTEIYSDISKKADMELQSAKKETMAMKEKLAGLPSKAEVRGVLSRQKVLEGMLAFVVKQRLACQKSMDWIPIYEKKQRVKSRLEDIEKRVHVSKERLNGLDTNGIVQQKFVEIARVELHAQQKRLEDYHDDFILRKKTLEKKSHTELDIASSTKKTQKIIQRIHALPKSTIPKQEEIDELEREKDDIRQKLVVLIGEVVDREGTPSKRLQEDVRTRYQNRLQFVEERLKVITKIEANFKQEKTYSNDLLRYQAVIKKCIQDRDTAIRSSKKTEEEDIFLEKSVVDLQTDIRFYETRLQPQGLRDLLKENEPCVVCGSTEHPLVGIPNPEEMEFHRRLKEIQKNHKDQQKRLTLYKKTIRDLRSDIVRFEERIRNGTSKVEERREELSGFQSERLILMKSITLADIDDLSIVRMNAENFKLNLEDGYQKFLDVSTSYSVRLSQRNKGQEQEKERQRLSGLLKEEEILISEKEVELVGVHNQLTIIQEKICRAFQLTSSEQIDMEWREKKHILEKDLQEKKTKKTLLEQEQRQEKIRIYELEEERVKESAEGAKLEEGSRSLGIELEALFSDLREGPVSMFPPDCSLEECVQICTSEREEIVQSEIRIQTEYAGNKKRIFLYEENTEAINDLAILEAQEEGWQRIRKALNLGVTFREFAQVLQLQNLIDRANVQLQQILNGYHLSILTTEDGHPVLDFNISKEGEKERPITTLSGGESFSIALAFALALGNLRKIHMPIQTLLIDEGFGNLDHQSADMVVSGLEALKKRNIQVGIISHVLPLQERIAARVSVSDLKISDVKTTPPEFKEKKKGSTKKKSLDKAET